MVALNADKEHIEPDAGFDVGESIVVAGQSALKDESLIRELEDSQALEVKSPPLLPESKTNSIAAAKPTILGDN